MKTTETAKTITIVLLAAIVLALTVTFKNNILLYSAFISFVIIIGANVLTKKAVGYFFETDVKIRFWSLYQYGFRKDMHFKKPVPMLWLSLLLALFSKGFLWWLAILEFDVAAKTERVSRRHGLYRFTQVTEWHMAWIAVWGIAINLILAIAGYFIGFEMFAKLSIYYAAWSILPISNLDGAKIFFSSKSMWAIIFTILVIFVGWGLII